MNAPITFTDMASDEGTQAERERESENAFGQEGDGRAAGDGKARDEEAMVNNAGSGTICLLQLGYIQHLGWHVVNHDGHRKNKKRSTYVLFCLIAMHILLYVAL